MPKKTVPATPGDTPAAEAAVQARAKPADAMAAGGSNNNSRPPQGAGVPRRMHIGGAARGEARLNVAMKVLLDPAARVRFSRIYSGQPRTWTR